MARMRDPLPKLRNALIAEGLLSETLEVKIRLKIQDEITEAVREDAEVRVRFANVDREPHARGLCSLQPKRSIPVSVAVAIAVAIPWCAADVPHFMEPC